MVASEYVADHVAPLRRETPARRRGSHTIELFDYLYQSWPPVLLAIGVVLVAFLIGRWWALLIALAVPLASPLYGEDSDGAPRWFWPTVMLGPPLLVALAVGVGARKLAQRRRRPVAAAPR